MEGHGQHISDHMSQGDNRSGSTAQLEEGKSRRRRDSKNILDVSALPECKDYAIARLTDWSQRYINFTPAFAFCLTILSTWPSLSLTLQAGLYNGGPIALVWGMLLATVGSTCIAAVLGEMASMSVPSAPRRLVS